MKKNIITTIILLLMTVLGTQAAELKVADKSLKIGTASTLDKNSTTNIKSGSVQYDGDKTLTLNGVDMKLSGDNKRGLLSTLSGLTVVLKGTNTISVGSAAGLRFEANAIIQGTGSLTITSGETGIYLNTNTTVTIQGSATLTANSTTSGHEGVYIKKNAMLIVQESATLTTKGENGFKGETNSNSESLKIQGNANVTVNKCDHHTIYRIQNFIVGGNAQVTLTGSYDRATVKDLVSFTPATGIQIATPQNAEFLANYKTFCLKGNTTGYNGNIVIRPALPITETYFPDANFRSFLKSQSYGKDGYLTDTELSEVKEISMSNKYIASLKGIGYFTELTYLSCENNQLTKLDVSKNTKLKKLNCCGNQINEAQMDALIYTLPTVSGGQFYVVFGTSDKNVCTRKQVAAAKNKGWTTYYWQGGNWTEYAGSDIVVVEINSTNFPDANFRNFLMSQDYGKDGYLTDAELSQVKEMDVSEKDIKSLKGIEYFTELKQLNCNINQLTTLDVSKNTALTSLECANNKLSELDLSKNIELVNVNCSYNQLESLSMSNNKKLTTLQCFGNQIAGSQMDALISSLPKVSGGKFYVIINENSKWSSDYSEQNICTTMQVAAANEKGWTVYRWQSGTWVEYAGSEPYIDIDYRHFPDNNFRYYLLSQSFGEDSKLTEEEIKAVTSMYVNDKKIASLIGIEYFTALTELSCYNNQLTSLDVSRNTELRWLHCYNNQLSTLVVNTKLIALNCYNNRLTKLDVSKNNIVTLKCQNNLLSTLDLSNSWGIYELHCYSNQIDEIAMDKIIASLPTASSNNPSKFYVIDSQDDNDQNSINSDLITAANRKYWTVYDWNGGNPVILADYVALINEDNFPDGTFRNWLLKKSIGQDGKLTKEEILETTTMDVPDMDIKSLKGIEYFTALTKLDCQDNDLNELDVSKNTRLTTLNCFSNYLTTLDVSKNPNLRWLNCSFNYIKDMQMDALIANLPTVNDGEFYAYFDDPDEGNDCTKTQVAAAKSKGWTVYYGYWDSEQEKYKWLEYGGRNNDQDITVGNALVAGFSCNNALDFTGSDVSAWIATGFRGGNVMLSRVNKVPAGTGLYLKAPKAGTYTVPVTNDKAYYANFFVGTPDGLTVGPTEVVGYENYQTLSFALSKTTGKPAFFPNTADKTYGAGKMYLHLPAWALGGAARLNDKVEMINDKVETINDNRGGVTDTAGETVPVTVSEVGAAGFSSNKSVDFTGITGISAWIATGFADGNVMLSRVYAVPAGTGVYLKADNPGTAVTRNIPVTTEKPCYANLFVGTGGMPLVAEPVECIDGEYFRTLSFAKSKTTGKPAFFPNTEEKEYAAGKMYLRLPEELVNLGSEARHPASEDARDEARAFGLVFCETECLDGNGDMANGTTAIRGRMADGMTDNRGVYDLQGRKVQNRKPLNKKAFIISGGRVHY